MENFIKINSQEEFILNICEAIKEQANENIDKKGSFTFVLSGGSTPKDIFIQLSKNYKDTIDWSKVHFFWLDERCVEPNHIDSNYKLANDYLISKLDKVGSIYRIKGELEPSNGSDEYQKRLIAFFGCESRVHFDFILLGMGEDGHIASLFPNSIELRKTNDIVLSTDTRYNGYRRITLGLNLINTSKFKLLMIKGKEKMKILHNKSLCLPIHKIENIEVIGLE
jgi:6-phosphogluconolactonase